VIVFVERVSASDGRLDKGRRDSVRMLDRPDVQGPAMATSGTPLVTVLHLLEDRHDRIRRPSRPAFGRKRGGPTIEVPSRPAYVHSAIDAAAAAENPSSSPFARQVVAGGVGLRPISPIVNPSRPHDSGGKSDERRPIRWPCLQNQYPCFRQTG